MFGILQNMTPVVKNILIINVLFYVAQWTFPMATEGLQLYPISSDSFKPWQLATHFFMHSSYSELYLPVVFISFNIR